MSVRQEILDPVGLDLLSGIHLIEASAGTGKTYTITMLVLRLLAEENVPIEQLLIVTYTKAATEELRSRIRERLLEARDLLADDVAGGEKTVDPTLAGWRDKILNPAEPLARIERCIGDFDLAPIFTIHGFCQRVLGEHALVSGQLFTTELITDIARIRLEIAEDFWRRRIYPLPVIACSNLIESFKEPAALLASVSTAIDPERKVIPEPEDLQRLVVDLETCCRELRAWWRRDGLRFCNFCQQAIAGGYFRKDFAAGFPAWGKELAFFLGSAEDSPPPELRWLGREQLLAELHGNKLRGDEKKRTYLAPCPLPGQLAADFSALQQKIILQLRVELARELRREVGVRLAKKSQVGFDDLIRNLSLALKRDTTRQFHRYLAARYRIGLIDEFQDTDASQYRIFTSIFHLPHQALYLIGDPKQAIYRFRGADINSYFAAKSAAFRLLTLPRNFRSHPALVDAVNNLFTARPQPFLFDEQLLGYEPVTAARSEQDLALERNGTSLAGLVCCQLPPNPEKQDGAWSSGAAAGCIQQFVAAEIVSLLATPPRLITEKNEGALAPRDIAILVRSHSQAEQFRETLSGVNIPSVVKSSRSVFATAECGDLLCLLQALLQPRNLELMRGALALRWFGFSGDDFLDFLENSERLNRYGLRFHGYGQLWQEQGLLVMMKQLLAQEDVLVTLAGMPGAERAIVNLNHLLGLAQEQQQVENLQPGELVQWLQEMRLQTGQSEHELLLESDDDAVQIVTMHGAKGLEYPVVFCPYSWYATTYTEKETAQVHCVVEGEHLADLGSPAFESHRDRAVSEEKSEDLRLFYVAVTRAKIRCYLMWAQVRPYGKVAASFASSLGYLLFPDGVCTYRQQQDQLRVLAETNGGEYRELSIAPTVSPRQAVAADVVLEARPPLTRTLTTAWQISSFSALAALSEDDTVDHRDLPASTAQSIGVPGLPAGPHFGNLIHELMERYEFVELGQAAGITDLENACRRYGIAADRTDLVRFLHNGVHTPLFGESGTHPRPFRLVDIDSGSCIKEMAFSLRTEWVDAARLNRVLSGEPTVLPLSHFGMEGFLTGFIDLFFHHEGRYYLLDYKTNHLGDSQEMYEKEQLSAAMQSHNYGLQYWLYTIVAHRYLSNMVDDYDYERDFGGVLYLFLRGMREERPGSGVFWCKPDVELVHRLDRLFGGAYDE